MIRFLLRLVLVLVLIAALLVGMTCCAAKAVFGSCAEVGVQQTVRNLEDFFLWLRDVWTLAREKLELCSSDSIKRAKDGVSGGVFYLGLAVIGVLAIPAAVLLGLIAGVWTLTDRLTALLSEKH